WPEGRLLASVRPACSPCLSATRLAPSGLGGIPMRLFRSLVLVVLLLLWAAPASGAEALVMKCPVCDHVDVDGSGLEPNATLSLTITDVRSGQDVLSGVRVTTDGSGSFSRAFDIDLARHPALLANLYEPSGSTLVLAAHANAQ